MFVRGIHCVGSSGLCLQFGNVDDVCCDGEICNSLLILFCRMACLGRDFDPLAQVPTDTLAAHPASNSKRRDGRCRALSAERVRKGCARVSRPRGIVRGTVRRRGLEKQRPQRASQGNVRKLMGENNRGTLPHPKQEKGSHQRALWSTGKVGRMGVPVHSLARPCCQKRPKLKWKGIFGPLRTLQYGECIVKSDEPPMPGMPGQSELLQ